MRSTDLHLDLHPEDLLERSANGELSLDEQTRLQTHLDRCSVCRFEQATRDDVRREVDEAENLDLQRLLAIALSPNGPRGQDGLTSRSSRKIPRRVSQMALLAAALMAAAGVSAAAGWRQVHATFSRHNRVIETVAEAPSVSPPSLHAKARYAEAFAPRSPVEITALAQPDDAAPVAAPETSRTLAAIPVRLRASNPVPVDTKREVQAPEAAQAADLPLDAARLFDEATRARRMGDRPAAIRAYRTLIATFPSSPEGGQARAALGRLLLDGGDAGGALRYFDDYLHIGGPLREDVMADRAVTLQRLGRSVDETAAWSTLLAAFPASVHAERARRRLIELEGH